MRSRTLSATRDIRRMVALATKRHKSYKNSQLFALNTESSFLRVWRGAPLVQRPIARREVAQLRIRAAQAEAELLARVRDPRSEPVEFHRDRELLEVAARCCRV